MANYDVDQNVYTFHDMDSWLEYTSNHDSKMLSPGGVAQKFGVSRQSVNNWIYRSREVRYYRYVTKRNGHYGAIPSDDVEKLMRRKSTKVWES